MSGGVKLEVFDVFVKISINFLSDFVDMLMYVFRLGIVIGFYGFILINMFNDIIMGEFVIRIVFVGFRVIDFDYINIMLIGY